MKKNKHFETKKINIKKAKKLFGKYCTLNEVAVNLCVSRTTLIKNLNKILFK